MHNRPLWIYQRAEHFNKYIYDPWNACHVTVIDLEMCVFPVLFTICAKRINLQCEDFIHDCDLYTPIFMTDNHRSSLTQTEFLNNKWCTRKGYKPPFTDSLSFVGKSGISKLAVLLVLVSSHSDCHETFVRLQKALEGNVLSLPIIMQIIHSLGKPITLLTCYGFPFFTNIA